VLGERGQVRDPLAQRRQLGADHGEAIVQVLAELPGLDHRAQVAVRRRDHPDVDVDRRGLANAADLALVQHAQELRLEIERLDRRLLDWHRSSDVSRRLATIPGVGPITATALAATIADPSMFRSGREFAAFLGLVPRQTSSGGKERLGRISKMGDRYLRTLLVVGATAVLRYAKTDGSTSKVWAQTLLARKPFKVVAVALANKTARIAWAVMARGQVFREGVEVRAMAA